MTTPDHAWPHPEGKHSATEGSNAPGMSAYIFLEATRSSSVRACVTLCTALRHRWALWMDTQTHGGCSTLVCLLFWTYSTSVWTLRGMGRLSESPWSQHLWPPEGDSRRHSREECLGSLTSCYSSRWMLLVGLWRICEIRGNALWSIISLLIFLVSN